MSTGVSCFFFIRSRVARGCNKNMQKRYQERERESTPTPTCGRRCEDEQSLMLSRQVSHSNKVAYINQSSRTPLSPAFWFFMCILVAATVAVAQAGILPHLDHHLEHHLEHELPHFTDAEVHHSEGIHLGHSAAIIHHDDHHLDAVPHHYSSSHYEAVPHYSSHYETVPHYSSHHYEHLHAAPVVHHHSHAALVHYKPHLDVHSHASLLSFAKHQLHGKYGKLRITETHY
ncbi:histidine-rich glycoprotein isoform X1 [Drosophila miranda]|uniref:histidine-rich glycoprotein isoform X1 n=2 Tax=Drosophila miranda TaxID=7229 RepID=UPI0007E64ED3|nr:histidine-rich glycoprotein isoform X1 [Drosophila miranda]